MTKSTIAISTLLFFLLTGHLLAAATNNNNIRLPSNVGAAAHDELEEGNSVPWGECCDDPRRSPLAIFPPFYSCKDKVKQCAAACRNCVEAPGGGGGLYVCNDAYQTTDPGPFCTPRPWGDCCDRAICTKSLPPICWCADEVEKCAAACKVCERVESSEPARYVCQDRFTGQPGPSCTPDEHK